jgi:hypothetical protein
VNRLAHRKCRHVARSRVLGTRRPTAVAEADASKTAGPNATSTRQATGCWATLWDGRRQSNIPFAGSQPSVGTSGRAPRQDRTNGNLWRLVRWKEMKRVTTVPPDVRLPDSQ